MRRQSALAFCLSVFVSLVIPTAAGPPALPEGWEIVEIVPAGTEFYYGAPGINDRGQVVFDRRLWPSLTEIEILLYDRGHVVQLTDDNVYDSFPRINNPGDIVWSRDVQGDGRASGIVRWRNGQLRTIFRMHGQRRNRGRYERPRTNRLEPRPRKRTGHDGRAVL